MSEIKFGTDGWRDYMYDRFNLPNVRRVVNAIARYTKDNHGESRGVVVGYDAGFFSDFFAKKAAEILTCALMAELRAVTGKPLLATLQDLYTKVGKFYTNRLDIHLPEPAKAMILERCRVSPPETVGAIKVNEVRKLDGFKFILSNGSWFLIRPSGTEPLIRIYFETNSTEDLQSLITNVRLPVDQWSKTA